MEKDVLKFNPYGQFRNGQFEAIREMSDAIERGDRVINFNAPTAFGKTLGLVILSRHLLSRGVIKRAIYTTPKVDLVNQIRKSSIYNIPTIVGKRNYPCPFLGTMEDVSEINANDCLYSFGKWRHTKECSGCEKEKSHIPENAMSSCNTCPYMLDMDRFIGAPLGATTIDRFKFDPMCRSNVDLLVIDESASLEDKLYNFGQIKIPVDDTGVKKGMQSKPLIECLKRWGEILVDDEEELSRRKDQYSIALNDNHFDVDVRSLYKAVSAELESVQRNIRKCEEVISLVESGTPYILVDDDVDPGVAKRYRQKYGKDYPQKIVFKLLDASGLFWKFVSGISHIVLASGTPTTDLIVDEYTNIVAPHPIPIDRRLIYYRPVGAMSAKERSATIPRMIEKIAEIHDIYHKNTLVHCHSYEIARNIGDGLKKFKAKVPNVVVQTSLTRKSSYESWLKMHDAVFLSVDYEEGIDLKGEQFPVCIVAKVPYPYLGDAWVSAKNKLDGWQWYQWNTIVNIEQACGRCTRDVEDFSSTYILDSNFGKLMNNSGTRSKFQPWFLEAIRT